jgi:hypothetical protein
VRPVFLTVEYLTTGGSFRLTPSGPMTTVTFTNGVIQVRPGAVACTTGPVNSDWLASGGSDRSFCFASKIWPATATDGILRTAAPHR